MGSGFASSSPRIQGTGPGAGSGAAFGGIGGGADGVTDAGAFCPIIVRALTDAASIAFTNSRRRISRSFVIKIRPPWMATLEAAPPHHNKDSEIVWVCNVATHCATKKGSSAVTYPILPRDYCSRDRRMKVISRNNAQHYTWPSAGSEHLCDGWHLHRTDALSIIEERMPPGTAEQRHLHQRATQFFYVLAGELIIELDSEEHRLPPSTGLTIPAGTPHQVFNRSSGDTRFLVISQPPSHGDRVSAAPAV
jgi:mannose-6-phosphate isomerase-like protein (cupin superfamily)